MSNILIRIIISVLAALAMILHLTKYVEFSWEALALLFIAVLPWLPAFVKSLKFGKDGVVEIELLREVEKIEFKLLEVEKKADASIDASLRGVVKKDDAATDASLRGAATTSTATATATEELKTNNDADPQKGEWGGNPVSNGKLLSARIEKIPGEDYFRRVILRVESTDAAKPLSGIVTFHLHPTFNKPDFDVPVSGGVAETSLVSYGAFTVGAEADDGATKLELDLASLNDGKDQFFNR